MGREVKKQKVLSLYRKAAELGDELAWEELGNCYKDGIFVEKNFEKAVV